MTKSLLSELVSAKTNSTYEAIINDLQLKHFSCVDHFFKPELINQLRQQLLDKYQQDDLKKAAIGNRTNETIINSIRGDYIQWINHQSKNTIEAAFFNKINQFIEYLNRTCFMGILHREFHYAVYPEGTFYKRHLDSFQSDQRRKLSMVLYLNDHHWSIKNGGELVIYTHQNTTETIIPKPGRLVVFESQLLEHEVKKVNSGKRLSITGWLKTR
ncbi:SM-20-related protein [Psychroflexus salarius]|uniref:SM-20-related protein n=1 Tax=Psychroflexus salarius TaxID=1155689 RepID=A0A1M4V016_9FLAO|nr:2OG-Fe(II) oxygenase [Psychroflexus salarius]SHE62316.1 SM-20-related protein [Psychroflexus salarius]